MRPRRVLESKTWHDLRGALSLGHVVSLIRSGPAMVSGLVTGAMLAAAVAITSSPRGGLSGSILATTVAAVPMITTTSVGTSPPPSVPQEPAPAQPTPSPSNIPSGLVSAMVDAAEKAAAEARMTLGVTVVDLRTDEIAVGSRGERQFFSASLSKLMLVVDMLDRGVALSASDGVLVRRALGQSDDDAMNALWAKYDGAGAMRRVAAGLGLEVTEGPDDPGLWGATVVSAADYARVYAHILHDMDSNDRKVIIEALASADETAADGFDQFFGLLGQSHTRFAKQGWMSYANKLYLHSAGVVYDQRTGCDYVVVLLSVRPASVGTRVAAAQLSTVADAVFGVLGESR